MTATILGVTFWKRSLSSLSAKLGDSLLLRSLFWWQAKGGILKGGIILTEIITNPGTTPITILAVNSDHGLSFAGEETRTMVSEFPFLYRSTVLLNSILAVQILRGLSFGLSFLISWGWGWFPHRQNNSKGKNKILRFWT